MLHQLVLMTLNFYRCCFEKMFPEKEWRPATLYEDKTLAIFLMENQVVGHIDVTMLLIREMLSNTNEKELE